MQSAGVAVFRARSEFLVRSNDITLGALWLSAPAQVEIAPPDNGRRGAVEPRWDNGAIRLDIHSVTGRSLHTDLFHRADLGGGHSVLSRNAQTVLDVRGSYEATLLDDAGHIVGWWKIRLQEPYEPRVFEGSIPVSPVDDTGVAVALNSEVDWIEDRVIDVYRGTSGGRIDGRSTGGR